MEVAYERAMHDVGSDDETRLRDCFEDHLKGIISKNILDCAEGAGDAHVSSVDSDGVEVWEAS